MSPRYVRNLVTGVVHDVPPGHFALTSEDYEVLDAPIQPAEAPEEGASVPAEAPKPKRKRANAPKPTD